MSAKTKQPGTTSPDKRISKRKDKRLKEVRETAIGGDDRKPNKKPKSGSKADRRRTHSPEHKVRLNRRSGAKREVNVKDKHIKEGVKMDVVNTIKYIIENHGKNIKSVAGSFEDKEMLSKMAQKCMATCLSGWTESGNELVSENTNLVLSKDSWQIAEDGSAKLHGGFGFDYDWLYDLTNADLIREDIDIDETETELDIDTFSDTLSNASNLLRKLSDKEIKKYVLNAVKSDEDVDLMNLKEVLEDSGVNWKFIGAEIIDEKINLLVRVRYTKDGTQEGVVEKKRSIEVKPIADVTDTTGDIGTDRDEIDLGFSEREPEERPEPEAGLDFEVNL